MPLLSRYSAPWQTFQQYAGYSCEKECVLMLQTLSRILVGGRDRGEGASRVNYASLSCPRRFGQNIVLPADFVSLNAASEGFCRNLARAFRLVRLQAAAGSPPTISAATHTTTPLRTSFNARPRSCSPPSCAPSADARPDVAAANKTLGRGMNLGNALDAPDRGRLGMRSNPNTSRTIKAAGFGLSACSVKWSGPRRRRRPLYHRLLISSAASTRYSTRP